MNEDDRLLAVKRFFESSPHFQVLLGRNAEVIDFNKTAADHIKKVHKKKLAANDYFVDFVAPGFVDTFIERYTKALEGISACEEGSTDLGPLGITWWEAAFEPARDPDNNIIGISYLVRNITERKNREQKIIDQNTSLLRMAHIQAHDLRAPLTSIMGLMNLIKEADYAAPIEYFEMLDQAVHRLDETIHDLVGKAHKTAATNEMSPGGVYHSEK